MNTKNAANDPEVNETAKDTGLSVIARKGTGLPSLPMITSFEVVESKGDNEPPIDIFVDENTGAMSLTINKVSIVDNMCFGVLKIDGGSRGGEVLTKELVDSDIKAMEILLEEEDLFAEGVAEKYRIMGNNVGKVNSVVEKFKDEKKAPVTKFGKVWQGVPTAALGDFIPLRRKLLDRLKNFKVEAERREREATAKDNLLREKTADEIPRIAFLVLECQGKTALEVKEIAAELISSEFNPHPDQADRYNEAYAKATSTLADMYETKEKEEVAAALQKDDDDKKAAAEQVELEELRAEKHEQEMKDTAYAHLANINELFGKCVGSTRSEIAGLIEEAKLEVIEGAKCNFHFDEDSAGAVIDKMNELYVGAKKKEEDVAAAKRAEDDRVAEEAADALEKETREKAEVAAALEKVNQELLLGAGFVFDGSFYHKGNIHKVPRDKVATWDTASVENFIIIVAKEISERKVAAEKAEEDRIKKEEVAKKKAIADKEAARKSYALKVEEMTVAVKECKGPDEMVMAILGGRIPHVRFMAE